MYSTEAKTKELYERVEEAATAITTRSRFRKDHQIELEGSLAAHLHVGRHLRTFRPVCAFMKSLAACRGEDKIILHGP